MRVDSWDVEGTLFGAQNARDAGGAVSLSQVPMSFYDDMEDRLFGLRGRVLRRAPASWAGLPRKGRGYPHPTPESSVVYDLLVQELGEPSICPKKGTARWLDHHLSLSYTGRWLVVWTTHRYYYKGCKHEYEMHEVTPELIERLRMDRPLQKTHVCNVNCYSPCSFRS